MRYNTLERIIKYMLKVKKNPDINILGSYGKQVRDAEDT